MLTRRFVLKASVGAAVGSLAARAGDVGEAQGPRIRYSATSTQGRAMLVKYAQAVRAMKDTARYSRSDPRSWTFQWYTHWIPGPSSPWDLVAAEKTRVLNDVFTGMPSNHPRRLLAESMWDTCQSHGSNPNDPMFFQQMYFCVWHRYFVYYFEDIIRGVLNDQTFTLPYWDYLSGSIADLSIPPEFRDATSPLYQATRNAWVNAGQRIDQQNQGVLNLNAMNEPAYIDSPDGSIGFCPMLDGNPHGLVHVLVGNTMNMGRVPYAANDPIFWLHHCNIDRLWETWNRAANHPNPMWPNRSLSYADGQGNAISRLPANADRIAMLNYQYDSGGSPPSRPSNLRIVQSAPRTPHASVPETVVLSARRTRVPLRPSGPASEHGRHRADDEESSGGRFYLVLGGISAPADAASTYNVYLDLPDSVEAPGPDGPHYLGTLSFFNAMEPGAHAHAGHHVAFNVTNTLGLLGAPLHASHMLTFVRHGDAESQPPAVGEVVLVQA